MSRIYLVCTLFLLSFAACRKTTPKSYEITSVELARSGAWADFGATIRIDSSLIYKYWGDYKNIKQGFFTGRVSKAFWDTLNLKLERVKFKTTHPEFEIGCMDCEYYELIVHWRNQKKRILRVGDEREDSIMKFIRWMDSSYKNLTLKRIKDSIKFEVTTHGLPKPPVKSVKFPPPTK